MIRRLIQFIAARRLAISVALLLVLPVVSAIIAATILISPAQVRHVIGPNKAGATRLIFFGFPGGVTVQFATGWEGEPPTFWGSIVVPGFTIPREIVIEHDQGRGDVFFPIAIRWWLLFLINIPLLLLALLLIWRWWQHRQITPGKCRICGYDLRATPDRCPECGAVSAEAGPAR